MKYDCEKTRNFYENEAEYVHRQAAKKIISCLIRYRNTKDWNGKS